jgi:hypothetical protein
MLFESTDMLSQPIAVQLKVQQSSKNVVFPICTGTYRKNPPAAYSLDHLIVDVRAFQVNGRVLEHHINPSRRRWAKYCSSKPWSAQYMSPYRAESLTGQGVDRST